MNSPGQTGKISISIGIIFAFLIVLSLSGMVGANPVINKQLNTDKWVRFAAPAIADIDNDGDKEIIAGDMNGKLYVWRDDGSYLPGFPKALNGIIYGSPALADVNNDGKLEIFITTWDQDGKGPSYGRLYGIRYNGAYLGGWPKELGGIKCSPGIGDIDGDGDLEIVIGLLTHYVHAYHHDGKMVSGFPFCNQDSIFSSPAVGDLDNDGVDEIVIGGDSSPGGHWAPGGVIHALEGNGKHMPGWPKTSPQVIWSSPAIADIDDDGGNEVIVGTGHFYAGVGNLMYAYNADGSKVPGWPAKTHDFNKDGHDDTRVFSSPAIGDLDGDRKLEVVVGCNDGYVYAYNHDGSRVPGWPVTVFGGSGDVLSSPALGDIDDDGKLEVVVGTGWHLMAFNNDGTGLPGYPRVLFNFKVVNGSPTLALLNGSNVDVLIGGGDTSTGAVFWFDITGKYHPGLMPWPTFQRDFRRTGFFKHPFRLYVPRDGAVINGAVNIIADVNVDEVTEVTFKVDGNPITSDNSRPFAILWNSNEVGAGAHILEIEATDAAGNYYYDKVNVEKTPNPVIFVPNLTKKYCGWTTPIVVQNISDQDTSITANYFKSTGQVIYPSMVKIPGSSSYGFNPDGLEQMNANFKGSSVAVAGESVQAIINQHSSLSSMAYEGITNGAEKVYLPNITKSYASWTTPFVIQNLETTRTAIVDVSFYQDGQSVADHVIHNLSINPGYSTGINPTSISQLATSWKGSVVVESTNNTKVMSVVNEHSSSGSMSYNGFIDGETEIFLPYITKSYSNWTTTFAIQNIGNSEATVTVEFYQSGQSAPIYTGQKTNLEANSYWGVNPTGIDSIPTGFRGSVKIISSSEKLVAIVNEHSSQDSMSYSGVLPGRCSQENNLPNITRNYYGWTTPFSVQNLGAQDTTVTVEFYEKGESIPLYTQVIPGLKPANSTVINPAGIGALGSTFQGSVKVTSSDTKIGTIVNELEASGQAMSYNGF